MSTTSTSTFSNDMNEMNMNMNMKSISISKLICITSSLIPTALATISIILHQSRQIRVRDALFLQVGLLIALILYQNIIILKTSHNNSTNSINSINSINNITEIDIMIGFSYIPIFLSLFVSCMDMYMCRSTTTTTTTTCSMKMCWNHSNQRIRFFRSFIKIGLQALVPASLSLVYTILFQFANINLKRLEHYSETKNETGKEDTTIMTNNGIDDDENSIGIIHGRELLLTYFITWIFITIWILKKRQQIVRKPSQKQPFNGSLSSSLSSSLPFQSGTTRDQNNSYYNNLNEWEQWNTPQLLSYVQELYERQLELTRHRQQQQGTHGTISTNMNNSYDDRSQFTSNNSRYHNNDDSRTNQKHKQIRVDINDDDDMIHILETLEMHRINGSILPYVQVQDLVHMDIDYCHALFLCMNFRSLVEKTITLKPTDEFNQTLDTNNGSGGNKGAGIDLDKWLGKKIGGEDVLPNDNDVETGKESYGPDEIDYNNQAQFPPSLSSAAVSSSPSPQYEQVKGIMSSRFGMELPEMKRPGNNGLDSTTSSLQNQYNSAPSEIGKMPPPMPTNYAIRPRQTQSSFESDLKLDSNILDRMPANIKEIALRNPDLVQAIHKKFKDEKEQGLDPNNYNYIYGNNNSKRERVVRFETDMDESEEVVHQKFASAKTPPEEYMDSNYDEESATLPLVTKEYDSMVEEGDEMVGLLRRRPSKKTS